MLYFPFTLSFFHKYKQNDASELQTMKWLSLFLLVDGSRIAIANSYNSFLSQLSLQIVVYSLKKWNVSFLLKNPWKLLCSWKIAIFLD